MGFSLTYAGVPFCLDNEEVQDWIDRRLPLADLRQLQPLPDAPPSRVLAGLAWPIWPSAPEVRLGQYFYPTGASRWSQFTGLATSSQVTQMMAAAYPSGSQATANTFVIKADPAPAGDTLSQGGISTKLFLLPPRPLADFGGSLDGLYLVTLVDERYYWQWQSPGSWKIGTASLDTWDELVTALATALSVTISSTATPATYGTPNEDSPLFSHYENSAALLDAVACNVGCNVVRNLDGTYKLEYPSVGNTQATNNRPGQVNTRSVPALAGGEILRDAQGNQPSVLTAILPSSVTVVFPKFHTTDKFIDTRDASDLLKPSYGDVYAKVITLSAAGSPFSSYSGFPGTKVFHDTCRACYTNTGDANPSNQTALDALALQVAKDYLAGLVGGIDEVYPGIRAWTPEGCNDVLWTYQRDRCSTRIQRKPWNYGVQEMQHALTGCATGTGGGSLVCLGPLVTDVTWDATTCVMTKTTQYLRVPIGSTLTNTAC